MSHVFLSYVRDDERRVRRLAADLEMLGVRVWLDRRDLMPGERWRDAIRRAINSGSFFIACFSRAYASRDQSYMNEELTLAVEQLRLRPTNRTWFIPVSLDGADVPDRHIGAGESLRDLQWVSLADDWRGGVATIAETILAMPEISPVQSIEGPLTSSAEPLGSRAHGEVTLNPVGAGRHILSDLLVLTVPWVIVLALVFEVRGTGFLLGMSSYALFVACYHSWVLYREYTVFSALHRLKSKPLDMLLVAGMFISIYQLSKEAPDFWDGVACVELFLIFLVAWEIYTIARGHRRYFRSHPAHWLEYRYWFVLDTGFLLLLGLAWVAKDHIERIVSASVVYTAGLSTGFAVGIFNVVRHEILIARIRRGALPSASMARTTSKDASVGSGGLTSR